MRALLPDPFLRRPIAHRALHDSEAGRPENGPSAIEAAAVAGYGIEIDLQLSGDGVPMVFHDYRLDRLTEATGAIASVRARELETLRLLGSDDRIARLERVLELIDGRVPLLVEIKDQAAVAGPGPLERAAASVLSRYSGPVAVMSFAPDSIAEMAVAAPTLARGLVTCPFSPEQTPDLAPERRAALRDIVDFERVGASFISHQADDLQRPRVGELRASGWPVLCWTVRSEAEARAARAFADNITFEGFRPALDPSSARTN